MVKKQSEIAKQKLKRPSQQALPQDPTSSLFQSELRPNPLLNSSTLASEYDFKLKTGKPKLGRPRTQERRLSLKYNEVDLIKNSFISYLDAIGFKQGLVFSAEEREILSQQQEVNQKLVIKGLPMIKWDAEHTWQRQEQLGKIKSILKQQKIPQIFIYEKLFDHLLDIADIFPRQITGEIYRLLCKLYSIVLNLNPLKTSQALQKLYTSSETDINEARKQPETSLNDLIAYIEEQDQFPFISGKFSHTFKPRKLPLTPQLTRLCENIVKYIRHLIKK